jgi:phosphoribosyl 1,2-cyclic phosphodiesterase
MSLSVTSINSGSNGNCYYIANEREAVLIDAGISCRETEKRMRRLGLKMDIVKAVFISHEHGDHIRGVEGIANKHKIPIYFTAATFRHSRLRVNEQHIRTFKAFEPIQIGGLTVLAFPKKHDAIDPHSFVVSGNGVNIGVFTDIGTACDHVTNHFRQCHAVFLEANYDEQMLETGRYPHHLKQRISGDHGHLSNKQALELFIKHKPEFLSHIFLSHLSKDNNNPELARKLFNGHAGGAKIIVASRYEETPVFTITNGAKKEQVKQPLRPAKSVQISLFS